MYSTCICSTTEPYNTVPHKWCNCSWYGLLLACFQSAGCSLKLQYCYGILIFCDQNCTHMYVHTSTRCYTLVCKYMYKGVMFYIQYMTYMLL